MVIDNQIKFKFLRRTEVILHEILKKFLSIGKIKISGDP